MGFSSKLDRLLTQFSINCRRLLVTYSEYSNVRKKKHLIQRVSLSSKQKAEIDSYFKKHYGRKLPYHWHRLYQSYTGNFQVEYFPEILFSTRLEPRLNSFHEAELLGDKNLLPLLIGNDSGLRIPHTFGSCVKGRFRDGELQFVSREHLCQLLANIGDCVVKKTIDTSSGRDVQVCCFIEGKDCGTGYTVSEVLESFGKDFVVQEKIKQHHTLQQLNGTSVNTFRVITYYCNDNVYVCPIALRLGRSNANRDNIHYGGICIGVDGNGILHEEAYSEYGDRYRVHPDSHVKFAQYRVGGGNFAQVIECVRKAHGYFPHLGLLSWDITLDEESQPVVIEINTTGQSAWFCQMVNGESLFGENTGKMLNICKKKKHSYT